MKTVIDPINISTDPVTGFAREVTFATLADMNEALIIEFNVMLKTTEGDIFHSDRISNPYKRTLRVDNNTPVLADGSYSLNEDGSFNWTEECTGEYDFIKAALSAGANVIDLITADVLRADAIKRFD